MGFVHLVSSSVVSIAKKNLPIYQTDPKVEAGA